MILFDLNNREVDYGRVKVDWVYDYFTQPLPEWLELVNCSISQNTDTNAVLTRLNSNAFISLQSKLFNLYNLDAIRLSIGNLTSLGTESVKLISQDGNTVIGFFKEPTGQAGLYLNSTFIKYASKKVSFANRTDIPDGQTSQFYSRAKNMGIHFLPQMKSVSLLLHDEEQCSHIFTEVININQQFRIVYTWNVASLTFSQAKINLWKSF